MKSIIKNIAVSEFVRVCLAVFFFVCLCGCRNKDDSNGQDQPPWYAPGEFRFARMDGGWIEVEKGVITGWPYLHSEENQEITGNLYTKYADRLLDVVEQMYVNWIWVTWSTGFSLEHEEQQRSEVKQLIEKAHERNIKVTAYLSLSNMFWEEMFLRVPDSREWVVKNSDGSPRLYGGVHESRYHADISNEGWRMYVKKRVSLALQAGADGIYFDNIFSNDPEYIVSFVDEVKELMDKRYPEKQMPLYVNNLNTQIVARCDMLLAERTREPIFSEGKLDSNIDVIKSFHKKAPPGVAEMFEHGANRNGPRREFMMSAHGYKISIAEAAAFQSSFYIAPEGVTLTEFIKGTSEGEEVIRAIGQYNKFLRDNKEIYTDIEKIADSEASPGLLRTVEGSEGNIVLCLVRAEKSGDYILHVLNYADVPEEKVKLSIDRAMFGNDVFRNIELISPDGRATALGDVNRGERKVDIEVLNLATYAMVRIGT